MQTNNYEKKKFFNNDRVFDMINLVLIVVLVIMVLYPLIYSFFASISSGRAVDSGRIVFFPQEITFSAYHHILTDTFFWRSYANTILITTFGTLFSMFISLTGAYALSKKNLPGHRLFNFILVFTMWFSAGMIPMYINFRDLGLLNSYTGIIIGFGVIAFNIILLRGAYQGIPSDLLEAAKIDGASEFQTFYKVCLPVIKPTTVTVTLMYAIVRWNGFFWAMIMLREPSMVPLQVYLRNVIVEREMATEFAQNLAEVSHSHSTVIYAIIIASMIPILIIFPYIQRFFKKGLMDGGVKE